MVVVVFPPLFFHASSVLSYTPCAQPIKMIVTNMQLIQFVTMMAQAGYILVFSCPYPRIITAGYLVYIFSLFLLFNDFKRKTYTAKPAADAGKPKKQ